MIKENISVLKINKLSQEQYDNALKAGKIKSNEIYLTPDTTNIVDQTYNPESYHAQSGKAIANELKQYADKTSVDTLETRVNNLSSSGLIRKIVTTLPSTTEAKDNIIYMVGPNSDNTYDEYMFISATNKFELIGNTAIEINDATTTTKGIVKLSNDISNSQTLAATPYAVNTAYTLAESKADKTIASSTENGLMSSIDKKRLDLIVGGVNSQLGSFSSKTILDLQNALNDWLSGCHDISNASTLFRCSDSWVNLWNNNDTTTFLKPGSQWTVTLVGTYLTNSGWVQLQICGYYTKKVYYVAHTSSGWTKVTQAAFLDDITKEQIGLGNVDNTTDANKSVSHANTADSATKATQDANGNTIHETYVTNDQIATLGGGDMLKNVYDTNGNNQVDKADDADKLGGIVANKYVQSSSLGSLATKSIIETSDLSTDIQNSLDNANSALQSFTETDPTVPAYIKSITQANITNWNNKSTFDGNYNNLTNKPTIPDQLSDLSDDTNHRTVSDTEKNTWNNKSNFDGDYNSLSNKPTALSNFTNDKNFITNTVNNLTNYYTKSNSYSKTEIDSLLSAISSLNITVVSVLPTTNISTSTIYLVPKSTTETNNIYDEYIYTNSKWEKIGSTSVDLTNYYTKTEIDEKGYSTFSGSYTDLNNKPTFATVATSGSYNDLSNKPAIPAAANNGTLTIQKNGSIVKTFTANQSTDVTANITVPTKVSELTNDKGYITTDNNTTYSISKTGNTITLTGSDGSTTSVTDSDTNTTYSNMKAATASAAGSAGLVPAPAAGKQTSFLRGDGTWVVPTNTTYSNFVKSGSGAKSGLVPAPPTTAGTTKYLREDGTWVVPPDNNTTYTEATTAKAGLMSASDKNKLDGIANNANNYTYTLPIATSDALGGVKIGYGTNGRNYAVQLSDGKMYVNVPWTDTDTTYDLSGYHTTAAFDTFVNKAFENLNNQTYIAKLALEAAADSEGNSIVDTYTKTEDLTEGIIIVKNATSAENANKDGNGNTITNTYATKIELTNTIANAITTALNTVV